MAFDYVDYVESNLDKARPSAGHEWTAVCPACKKFGGFYVNCASPSEDDKAGRWVCFKCDAKGKTFAGLIAIVEDIEYSEAAKIIFKTGVEFRRRETTETLRTRIEGLRAREESLDWDKAWGDGKTQEELPAEFIPVWNGKRWDVPDYLSDRKFYRETLRDWGVGYCMRGKYAGRAVIPFECPNGKSFTARDMTGEQEPRYLNPTGIDHGRLLYGWDKVPLGSDFSLVEGPLDAMKFNQHGIPALGCGGKTLRLDQLLLLFRRPARVRVTVMFDPEELLAPIGAAEQLITRFRNLFIGKLPDGEDPGSSSRKIAREAMRSASAFDGNRTGRVFGALESAIKATSKRYA